MQKQQKEEFENTIRDLKNEIATIREDFKMSK